MSNSITYSAHQVLTNVDMSNGLTSVFISIISIATSSVASNDNERRFAVWLAAKDQAIFGSGTVGFDVAEMPWHNATFLADKFFLLTAINTAKNKLTWQVLGYQPHEESVLNALLQFEQLINAFKFEHCKFTAETDAENIPAVLEKCKIHSIYLHTEGCVICNDS